MEPAFDPAAVCSTLRHGITAGYWTLEDLDSPSQHWSMNVKASYSIPRFKHRPYRNLLRDHPPVATATSPNKGQPDVDLRAGQRAPLPGIDHGPDRQGPQNRVPDQPDYGDTGHLGAAWHDSSPGSRELHQQQVEPSPQGSADLDADW